MKVNNSIFTEFGKALRNGEFKKLHPDSYEYKEIWQQEYYKCLNGVTYGGKYMPGRLYFYVNFGTIDIIDETTGRKVRGLPLLRDVEWEVFTNFDKAIELKKGFMWISGRRGGKSFIGSSLVAYDFVMFEKSSSVISGGDSDKVMPLMEKVKSHLDGLIETAFYIPLLKENTKDDLVSGWREKDPTTNTWTTKCHDRIIYNRNFKNKHTAANGLSANIFVFEEVGMFDNLIDSYSSSEPCWKEGTTWFGTPFLCGTGGDMEKGSIEAKKMFEDPDTYNLMKFYDNVTDSEGVITGYRERCFFLPGYKVLNDFKDEFGNTQVEQAKKALLDKRAILKKGKELNALLKEIQYYPLTPEEAFLSSSGNIFPIELLQEQVEKIVLSSTLREAGMRCTLKFEDGKVVHIPNSDLREASFPIKKGLNNDGCITIYELPEYGFNNQIPYGLYVGGTDPYAQDTAEESPSLGSTFIFKRFHKPGSTHNQIVAEYTGRPSTNDEYFETLRRLLIFYNARTLYENNIPGLKQYFEQKNSLQYLFEQPSIIKDIQLTSTVERKYGIHMTQQIKIYMINTIRNYLLEEYEEGHTNVEKILSINLLQELINYNEDNNFDRVIAFGLCILQNIEMHKEVVEEDNITTNYFTDFFNRHGFNNKIDDKLMQKESVRSKTQLLKEW